MSVTNTVVFATSVIAAPQSLRTAAMFASAWRACASTPPRTMPPPEGSSPTWPAHTIQSPARTAGEYGPAAGGALGVGMGRTLIWLPRCAIPGSAASARSRDREPIGTAERIPCRGRDRSEHCVARAPARRTVGVDDADIDRGRVRGTKYAERADREVVDLSGIRIDRQRFRLHPTQCHVRGADRVRPQDDFIERITGPDLDGDVLHRSTVDRRARVRTGAARCDDLDVAAERARNEDRLLGESRRTQRAADARPRNFDLLPPRAYLDPVRRRPDLRCARATH